MRVSGVAEWGSDRGRRNRNAWRETGVLRREGQLWADIGVVTAKSAHLSPQALRQCQARAQVVVHDEHVQRPLCAQATTGTRTRTE